MTITAKNVKKAEASISPSTQWNVPDWQDAAAYPKPDDLTLTYWRWEFLRRWDKYRQAWQAHAQGTHKYLLARAKHKKNLLTPNHPQFRATGDYLLAEADPGTKQEREAFTCIQVLHKYCMIGGLPNPAIRTPFMLSFDSSFGGMYTGRGDVVEVLVENGHVLYEFDLTRPIHPQLVQAQQDLLDQQLHRRKRKEARRVHQHLFPLYLRVLDARDCGTRFREIGETLLQKVDYDDAIKRAHDLYMQAHHLQSNLSKYF